MSYDLAFWRECAPVNKSPNLIYRELLENKRIERLAELPIDKIKSRFAERFPGIDDCLTHLEWEGEGSYFEVTWPPDPVTGLIVHCGYQLLKSPDTLNGIIGVANEFGCALYDPQVNERFEQPDTMLD